jgi:hypothetical protein
MALHYSRISKSPENIQAKISCITNMTYIYNMRTSYFTHYELYKLGLRKIHFSDTFSVNFHSPAFITLKVTRNLLLIGGATIALVQW